MIAVRPSVHGQDQTVNGNMGISGALDVYGDTFNLGSWATDATKFGLAITYSEDTNHVGTLTLTSTRPSNGWLWQKASSSGSANLPQMSLSTGNALTLYDQTTPAPVAKIVLDPLGISVFGTSATFNGSDNEMPNQKITGSASVLTVSLADARYPVHNGGIFGNSLSLGVSTTANGMGATAVGDGATADGSGGTSVGQGARASGGNSTAVGSNATASGGYSVSLGCSTSAGGNDSFALGLFTTASGYGAEAIGIFSTSSGYASNAVGISSLANAEGSVSLGGWSAASSFAAESLGYHSSASGNSSLALGSYSSASGSCATALSTSSVASGDYAVSAGRTTASSLYQVSVGAYGLTGGDPHNWISTDDLFTVGNGQSAAAPSDAFVVYKNGNAALQGVLSVAPGGDIPMYTGN